MLDTGTLLVAAENYIADRRHPVGRSMALLGVRTPGDPDRALSLRRLVARSRGEAPVDVVVVDGRVTITAGGDVLTLRGDRYPPTGRHTPFSGTLDWVGASPEASTDGLYLVRINLRQPHRRPRNRTMLFAADTGLVTRPIPGPGTVVWGSHYANGHVAFADHSLGSWFGGRLSHKPQIMILNVCPDRQRTAE